MEFNPFSEKEVQNVKLVFGTHPQEKDFPQHIRFGVKPLEINNETGDTYQFENAMDEIHRLTRNARLCDEFYAELNQNNYPYTLEESRWSWNKGEMIRHEFIMFGVTYEKLPYITISFTDTTTLDQKDQVVEFILGKIHRKFGCVFQRKTKDRYTNFATEIRMFSETYGWCTFSLDITTYDTLGCVENIQEVKHELSEDEVNKLSVGSNGTISQIKNDYRFEDGKIVRIEQVKTYDCAGAQ